MRRLSIARPVQAALLGVTVTLTAIAAVGVGAITAIVAGGGLALLAALALVAAVRRALDAVEAERRRLATTIDALGDALVITGPEGLVEAVNPRAATLVPDQRPGQRMLPPAPLATALDHEVRVERDGRVLAVTAAPLAGAAGHVWTIRDVSERARLEQRKSDFVATASHELRSPLTSIKGFVELLEASRGLTARQQEWVAIVRVSTDRLVELVSDLLDVTRLEAGQVEIRRRPTDVGELLAEVAGLLGARVAEKHQSLDLDVAADLPRALVDPGRVRQIVVNLLTNAHLYTDAGGRLAVKAMADGEALVLRVTDTGRGMDPETAAHAFDRFHRGVERDGPKGTGLGLAIVRSLVELHHGTVEVQSATGVGTTFAVRFPRAIDAGGLDTTVRDVLPGRRVLVVDDEPAVGRVIAAHLVSFGAEATVVHSGAAALEALRTGGFDALTLDILMPGMTGFEVLRAVRADPALAALPVVVVSVFSGREALTGEWVVPKPIEAEELADALGAAVVAGRIRVLAVGVPGVRAELDAELDALGIAHEWAADPDDVAVLCSRRRYEVALVDAGLAAPGDTLAALDLRGRRLRRAVLVFSADGAAPAYAHLDAEPVAVAGAGAAVLGLLELQVPDPAAG